MISHRATQRFALGIEPSTSQLWNASRQTPLTVFFRRGCRPKGSTRHRPGVASPATQSQTTISGVPIANDAQQGAAWRVIVKRNWKWLSCSSPSGFA